MGFWFKIDQVITSFHFQNFFWSFELLSTDIITVHTSN